MSKDKLYNKDNILDSILTNHVSETCKENDVLNNGKLDYALTQAKILFASINKMVVNTYNYSKNTVYNYTKKFSKNYRIKDFVEQYITNDTKKNLLNKKIINPNCNFNIPSAGSNQAFTFCQRDAQNTSYFMQKIYNRSMDYIDDKIKDEYDVDIFKKCLFYTIFTTQEYVNYMLNVEDYNLFWHSFLDLLIKNNNTLTEDEIYTISSTIQDSINNMYKIKDCINDVAEVTNHEILDKINISDINKGYKYFINKYSGKISNIFYKHNNESLRKCLDYLEKQSKIEANSLFSELNDIAFFPKENFIEIFILSLIYNVYSQDNLNETRSDLLKEYINQVFACGLDSE